jgi:hypothetical protein
LFFSFVATARTPIVEPREQDIRTGDALQRESPVGSLGDTAGSERHHQDRDQIQGSHSGQPGAEGPEGVREGV